MEPISPYFVLHNWQRKLFALIAAVIIWFLVSHSITDTKMIRNVPIRIYNLPADKTIIGLLPNGILNKRINLILSGSKDVIEQIRPGDLEVNIDAAAIDHADWIVQIGKKNLVSLNPNIDIASNINSVSHTEFVIKLNRLVTAKVDVQIMPPIGEAPEGYQFLGIWPQKLVQTINGPEEEIMRLQSKGLELTFDLNEISKSSLDAIQEASGANGNNEVAFPVPTKWKNVTISLCNKIIEELNDPDVQHLQIDFLKLELLAVEEKIPLRIFFPVRNLATVNPNSLSFALNKNVSEEHAVSLFTHPLFVKHISRLFLNVVKDFLVINVVASPKSEGDVLQWGIEVVTPKELEETYVAYQMAESAHNKHGSRITRKKELFYRQRFRDYLHRLALYLSKDHKLNIQSSINGNKIEITDY